MIPLGYSQNCESAVSYAHTADGMIGFFESYSESDCSIHLLRWDFGDGTYSVAANPIHTFPELGEYVVCLELNVEDALGSISSTTTCQTLEFAFNVCSLIPELQLNMEEGQLMALNITQINATTSIISCSWNLGDGNSLEGESITHLYALSGIYEVCADVTAVSGRDTCYAQLCKPVQVSFEVPEFTIELSESQPFECLYELKVINDLPTDVELLSRVWFYNGQDVLTDDFVVNVQNSDPIEVIVKEYYSFRGEEFTKTLAYTIYPQCTEVALNVDSEQLDEVLVLYSEGSLMINSRGINLSSITVYAVNGQLIHSEQNANSYSLPIEPGFYLLNIEASGENQVRKIMCSF